MENILIAGATGATGKRVIEILNNSESLLSNPVTLAPLGKDYGSSKPNSLKPYHHNR